MPYWSCYFHVVWATRMREPELRLEEFGVVEGIVVTVLVEGRVVVHAVGCMPDHVHVVASIPPSLATSIVVKRWKGASSHAVNHERRFREPRFAWQTQYGVHTFGRNALPRVLDYVTHQPERHRADDLWSGLERTDPERPPSPEGTLPP